MVKNKDFTMVFKNWGARAPPPPDAYARNISQMLKSG